MQPWGKHHLALMGRYCGVSASSSGKRGANIRALGPEGVAHAADGVNQAPFTILLQFAAQIAHIHLNHVGVGIFIALAPDLFEDLLAADVSSLVLEQQEQENQSANTCSCIQ